MKLFFRENIKLCVASSWMILSFSFLLGLSACSKSCDPSPSEKHSSTAQKNVNPSVTPKAGKMLFNFAYETVTDFLIVKADPNTGDRWTARLQRASADSPIWEIRSDGNHGPLVDRRAEGGLVLHLLDTLRTLQVRQTEVPGPESSLGLTPPRFALQWRATTPDTGASAEFELQVGMPSREKGETYASVPTKPAFTASGAAFQMLDYIENFNSLRLKTWAGITADEVDEIEIKRGKSLVFYAQREGSEWNDRNHKAIRADVGAWLEKIAHLRVLAYIDDANQAKTLRARIEQRPELEVIFKDRHGVATTVRLGKTDGKVLALSSARPDGVFEVYPVSLQALDSPSNR